MDLTIGIPFFNEGTKLRSCVKSVQNQKAKIVLSDNGSSDGCSNFILNKKSKKIILYKNKKNIGSFKNFGSVLKKAKTKYFMWLGGHDHLNKEFCSEILLSLKNNAGKILVPAALNFINDPKKAKALFRPWLKGLESKNSFERVRTLIRNLDTCEEFHSVYPRALILSIWNKWESQLYGMLGPDIAIMIGAAKERQYKICEKAIYYRRKLSAKNNKSYYKKLYLIKQKKSLNYKDLCAVIEKILFENDQYGKIEKLLLQIELYRRWGKPRKINLNQWPAYLLSKIIWK